MIATKENIKLAAAAIRKISAEVITTNPVYWHEEFARAALSAVPDRVVGEADVEAVARAMVAALREDCTNFLGDCYAHTSDKECSQEGGWATEVDGEFDLGCLARAAIAAMPDRLNMDAMVECRANGIEPIDKAQELVERKPTHRCKICDALWLKYDDGTWSLCSSTCGLCCDNVPMGDQIEPIRPSWNELRRRAAAKTLAAMPRPSNEDRLREALGQAMVVIDYAAEYLWNGRPDAIQQRPVHIDTALRISRKALKSSEGEGL